MAGRGFQCQAGHSLTPFAATFTRQPASVANKRLTGKVNPLNATLTKNWGEGSRLWLTSHPQHPSSRITEHKSVPLLVGACDRARASLQTLLPRATEHGSRCTLFASFNKRPVAFPPHGTSRPSKQTP